MTNDNNQPVTKLELQKELNRALFDFFDQILSPYFEKHVEKRFDRVEERLDRVEEHQEEHDRRFDKLDDRLDRHGQWLENHDKRLQKLEPAANIA